MIFLTDTCFWKHIEEIHLHKKIDLRPSISLYKWGITLSVKQELTHFEIEEFLKIDEAFLIPVSDKEIKKYQQQYPFFIEYDIADQTLMVVAIRDRCPILTDDRSLFRAARSIGIEALLLPHFCLFLIKEGQISKRDVAQIIKFWEESKRFKLKELKKFKAELQAIR
jgi:rRNA-processing protein FCF1